MAITVEHVNRYAQVLNTYTFNTSRVHIGRAHDNDLVLADDYVDAHHLLIDMDAITHDIKVMDLGSENGLTIIRGKRKKENVLGAASLASGNTLLLGKSYLRIYADGHRVPAAKPLSSWELLASVCSAPFVVAMLFALSVMLLFVDHYLSRTINDGYSDFFVALIVVIMIVVSYAGFWALIGKSVKHDGRFSVHVFIALMVINFEFFYLLFTPFVSFNFGAQQWTSNIGFSINILIGFLVCYLGISLATHLGRTSKIFISLLIPLLLIVPKISKWPKDEFSARPPYEKALVAPSLNFRAQTDNKKFIQMASDLYQQVEDE